MTENGDLSHAGDARLSAETQTGGLGAQRGAQVPSRGTREDDPRVLAVMAWVWNASNWPANLQVHILGRPVPYEFALRLLAVADAADPLRKDAA